jgi:uncharacterized protein YkwD
MAMRVKIVVGAAVITAFSGAGGFAARADDLATAIRDGVNQLRQPCVPIGVDPSLTAAAQRHANDMMINGVDGGHIGSDGSSPQARAADAGHTGGGYTAEIIYWGTGSRANPTAALDWWMQSLAHRAVILDCALTAAGFATAWAGNKMIVVGDFASR